MKAIVDPLAGFCGGVSRAIELVEQALSKGEKLAVKGELIHNRLEVDRLYNLGLKSINQLEEARESTVLVRTHGEESAFFQRAKDMKILYLDATCPKVMRSQKVIRRAHKEGKQIIVVGHLNHPEVIALQGHCDGDAIVVNRDEVTAGIDPRRPTLLIAQTTVDPDTYANWQKKLRREVVDLEVFDSRCSFVNRRQKELKQFASEHPAIIFVGGRHSSNTRLLYNICLNANSNTLFIEDETELDWEWLKQFDEVGISGSASTPMWLLKKVSEAVLEKF